MAKAGRSTLKTYFKANAIPTAENFADLIDSALNPAEDGVSKTSGGPLEIVAGTDGQKRALALYADAEGGADWFVTLQGGVGIVASGEDVPRFYITSSGYIGVGTWDPEDLLHLAGGNLFVEGNVTLSGTLRAGTGSTMVYESFDSMHKTHPNGGNLRVQGTRHHQIVVVSKENHAGIEIVSETAYKKEEGSVPASGGFPYLDFAHGVKWDADSGRQGVRIWAPSNESLEVHGPGGGDVDFTVVGNVTATGTVTAKGVSIASNATSTSALSVDAARLLINSITPVSGGNRAVFRFKADADLVSVVAALVCLAKS